MFSTTLAAAAVGGLLASGSLAVPPAWQPDYKTALVQSSEQHKPVVVFIAQGAGGYGNLITDGGLTPELAQLLKQRYVCLYVNTATDDGKATAATFGLDRGLVVSDKTGQLQAFRHQGEIARTDLAKQLKSISEQEQVVKTELSGGATLPSAPAPVYTYSQPVEQHPVGPIRQTFGNVRQFFGGT